MDALEGIKSGAGLQERKRARHRAAQYMIEEGKLWFVAGGTCMQEPGKCVTKEETVALARIEHKKGGHFHCNLLKIALLTPIASTNL